MLRKPTQIFRATLQEVPLPILGPEVSEDGSPVRGFRRVHLLVQEEPPIEIAFDVDLSKPNIDARDSYWSQVPSGGQIFKIELLPHQNIVGRSTGELHELAIIVEYHES